MQKITLTQGKIALVDDEDFDFLNQWKWFALKSNRTFYAARTAGRKEIIYMHRFILGLIDSKKISDHIDRDGLNNQRSNLRIASKRQSGANRNSFTNSSSKFLGVSWDKKSNKWRASIKDESKNNNLGVFVNELDAAVAYNKKALEVHGEFANLNKI